jgi:hypothetical protein
LCLNENESMSSCEKSVAFTALGSLLAAVEGETVRTSVSRGLRFLAADAECTHCSLCRLGQFEAFTQLFSVERAK